MCIKPLASLCPPIHNSHQKLPNQSSIVAQQKRIRLVSMKTQGNSCSRSVGQGSGVAMSCGVAHRCGSDLAWLWLWLLPAAVALIQPLPWEFPYAAGAALKRLNKQRKKQT